VTGLLVWQLVHLYWLTTDVVLFRITGLSHLELSGLYKSLIILVDYTEIPAIILTSILYLKQIQEKPVQLENSSGTSNSVLQNWWHSLMSFNWSSFIFLVLINLQWLHIFWITDEMLLSSFNGSETVFSQAWLSWLAIIIDYLELPVIYDTLKKTFHLLLKPA
jgi:hypothetical protein